LNAKLLADGPVKKEEQSKQTSRQPITDQPTGKLSSSDNSFSLQKTA
jgi:hypothetical protein